LIEDAALVVVSMTLVVYLPSTTEVGGTL